MTATRKSGAKVTVDFLSKTATVFDADGTILQTYLPPDSGHSQSVTFDPSDPQPVLGHNTVEGGRDAEAMAKLAVEAALPSVGAVVELLGEDAGPTAPPVGIDNSNMRETGREGGVGEREYVNPNASSSSLNQQAADAQARADDLKTRADAAAEAEKSDTKTTTRSKKDE